MTRFNICKSIKTQSLICILKLRTTNNTAKHLSKRTLSWCLGRLSISKQRKKMRSSPPNLMTTRRKLSKCIMRKKTCSIKSICKLNSGSNSKPLYTRITCHKTINKNRFNQCMISVIDRLIRKRQHLRKKRGKELNCIIHMPSSNKKVKQNLRLI
jgi:hypothetical protein